MPLRTAPSAAISWNALRGYINMQVTDNECRLCSEDYRRAHDCPRERGIKGLVELSCMIEHQVERERKKGR